ncbi:DUF2238 domain-containing protein [Paenisporosarcina indica]|uniref:DUF2238 domain-containing protein n=1 Tax=Paenisporosarcina indica TaxID=650093 RepID=UPI00094FAFBF|nr:DUF2238 domain-containing protein [Paenisporosarcina indica]
MVISKSRKSDRYLLLVVAIFFIWSVIQPTQYWIWVVEVLPAGVVLVVAIITYNKFRLTTLSYTVIAIISILTFIGGHYSYSEVPLFNWLKDEFDLSRNHYDRLGHFLKGLFAIVVREILLRKTPLSKGAWLFGITTSIMLAIAALYEIIEWLSTKFPTKGKVSEDFLGMQGDKWDAQWDMFLAFVGSLLALLVLSKLHDKLLKRLIESPEKK